MSTLLFLSALVSLACSVTTLLPRRFKSLSGMVTTFLVSFVTIEQAWLLVLIQFIWVCVLGLAGAFEGGLAGLSILLFLASWSVLAWQVLLAQRTGHITDKSLREALGDDYLDTIPDVRRAHIRTEIKFSDWSNPLGFDKKNIEVIKNVAYGPYGLKNFLDIYKPKNPPQEGCPVLLQIHGGAFVSGNKDTQGLPLAHYLAARGWIVASINYRLSPSVAMPAHIHDCKRALSWIRANGHEYGMNKDFVAVSGNSAGGYLAAMMGVSAKDKYFQPEDVEGDMSVQACVPIFGTFDSTNSEGQSLSVAPLSQIIEQQILHCTMEQNPEFWKKNTPLFKIDQDTSPMFLIHGSNDSIIPHSESEVFLKHLKEKSQSPVAYSKLVGAEHGFELMHSIRNDYVITAVHQFLEYNYAAFQRKAKSK